MGLRRRGRVVLEEEHRLVRVEVMTIRRKNKREDGRSGMRFMAETQEEIKRP